MRYYEGPRLYLRRRKGRAPTWCLVDFGKEWSLRLSEDRREEAEKALADYAAQNNKTVIPKWTRSQVGTVATVRLIYFVSTIEVADYPVKIGMATDGADIRLKGLQTANPYELMVLATMRGTRAGEAELHRRFKDSRIRGEWFRRTPELMALISRAANPTKEAA